MSGNRSKKTLATHSPADAAAADKAFPKGIQCLEVFHWAPVERVVNEAMRLYPPAYMIGREAIRETEVGPYTMKKGDIVIMSQDIIQRDPKYYRDPERFDPDRWLPENCEGLPKFAYFPFGGGRRLCVGEAFAWMEGVLVIATLAQKWRFELKPGHQIGLNPNVTLRPKGGMPMIAHARG